MDTKSLSEFIFGNQTQGQTQTRGAAAGSLNIQNYLIMVTTWHALKYPNGLVNVSESEIRSNCQDVAYLNLLGTDVFQTIFQRFSQQGDNTQKIQSYRSSVQRQTA